MIAIRRINRLTWCFVALGMAAAQGIAFADTYWADGAGSWFTASNWSAGVPTATTFALVNNGGTARVFSNGAQADVLILGQGVGESGSLEVFNSGAVQGVLTLGTGGGFAGWLGVGVGGHGTMIISGSASVSDEAVFLGAGLFGPPVGSGSVSVIGPNASWTNNENLDFGNGSLTITGGGTVTDKDVGIGEGHTITTVTGAGSLWKITSTLDSASSGGTDVITIDSGGSVSIGGQASIGATDILHIGSGGAPGTFQAFNLVNNGSLHFNHTGAVTFSSPLSGTGTVLKDGPGSTAITRAAGFTGSITAQAGQLILTNTVGAAAFQTIGDGLLRFDAAVVNLGSSEIRAGGDVPIEYKNSTVNGGFLRGTGVHNLLAGATHTFNGTTSFGANIEQNGMANFNNFTNAGTITSNTDLNYNGGVNTSSGTLTVNSELIAQDFRNDGVWVINNGGQVDNGANNLVCGGGSRTTLNPGALMFLSDDTSWELNGALLVNNGEVYGTTNVNFGSLAKGDGYFETINVLDGGTFSPGNSPGEVNVDSMSLNKGGRLVLEIRDFNGTPGIDFDQINVAGDLTMNAGTTPNSKFTIALVTLDAANQPGLADDFNPSQVLSRLPFDVGGTISGFSADAIAFDLSGFQNNLAGGTFAVSPTADGLSIIFQPAHPGDFNLDGMVDAADFVAWRKTDGTQAGYDTWRAHFGETAGSGADSNAIAAVPEPRTAVMLISAAAVGSCLRRRRCA